MEGKQWQNQVISAPGPLHNAEFLHSNLTSLDLAFLLSIKGSDSLFCRHPRGPSTTVCPCGHAFHCSKIHRSEMFFKWFHLMKSLQIFQSLKSSHKHHQKPSCKNNNPVKRALTCPQLTTISKVWLFSLWRVNPGGATWKVKGKMQSPHICQLPCEQSPRGGEDEPCVAWRSGVQAEETAGRYKAHRQNILGTIGASEGSSVTGVEWAKEA